MPQSFQLRLQDQRSRPSEIWALDALRMVSRILDLGLPHIRRRKVVRILDLGVTRIQCRTMLRILDLGLLASSAPVSRVHESDPEIQCRTMLRNLEQGLFASSASHPVPQCLEFRIS